VTGVGDNPPRMADLMRFRYLFEQMVRRELRQKYQGSILGVAWYVVNPLVLMGAYYLLFGKVFRLANHPSYPLFIIVGLVVWLFFSQTLLTAATSLLDQGALIRKAIFPRETIPGAVVTVQMVIFLVIMALVVLVIVPVRGTFDPALLALPPLLLALFAFVLGLALGVSVLHAYFRDVAPILSAALLPWFMLSPIFFEPADITSRAVYRDVLTWVNPVAPFITAMRDILYRGDFPQADTALYIAAAAIIALVGGRALFVRMQRELAVVV
jgi:ABC-type polysaccharide/polyol phosphate export permease